MDDLQEDPLETKNLIGSRKHQDIAKQINKELFDQLKDSKGMYIPIFPDAGNQQNLRYEFGSPAAEFPSDIKRSEDKTSSKK